MVWIDAISADDARRRRWRRRHRGHHRVSFQRGVWLPVTRVAPFWHGSASMARPGSRGRLPAGRSEISITLGTFPNGRTTATVRLSRWERFHRQRSRPAAGLARTPPPAGPPHQGRGGDTHHHSRGHGSRAMSTKPGLTARRRCGTTVGGGVALPAPTHTPLAPRRYVAFVHGSAPMHNSMHSVQRRGTNRPISLPSRPFCTGP